MCATCSLMSFNVFWTIFEALLITLGTHNCKYCCAYFDVVLGMTWTLRFCACSINPPQVHLFLKVKFCFFCVENVVLDFSAPFFLAENQPSNAEELLSPQPSHKLLVLAAPLRVHNQTDLTLVLRPRLERLQRESLHLFRTYPRGIPLALKGALGVRIPRFFLMLPTTTTATTTTTTTTTTTSSPA